MKRKKESVITILKYYTIKYTLIFLLILVASLLLIKMDLDQRIRLETANEIALKYQRDMQALELVISNESDVLGPRALQYLEQCFGAYKNFKEEPLSVKPFPKASKVKFYAYDRVRQQLSADFNQKAYVSVVPVFEFFNLKTGGFEMQKKGIPVGIIKDPYFGQLAYGYLKMTDDQRYYFLVTFSLEETLADIYQSAYSVNDPPYTFLFNGEDVDKEALKERDPIHMKLDENKDAMAYTFVSETGYEEYQFAVGKIQMISSLESFGFFVEILLVIIFIFAFAGYLNYVSFKRTYQQLVNASQLFDQASLLAEDIKLETYDVNEILLFLSIAKELLQNIEILISEKKEQEEMLNAENELNLTMRMTAQGLQQASLEMCESLNDTLADYKSRAYQSLKALMYAIEIRDNYTRGHSDRVEFYAEIIASKMNISMIQLENVRYGALLHDVGKIGIRETLLNKSINVTFEDTEAFKRHPQIGCDIIESADLMDEVKWIILQHHERMDGTGYPDGLSGEQIHPLARIVAVADAYDAMTSHRPYRKNPMTRLEAIQELQNHSGSQFDKDVVRVFIDYLINEEQKG